ncbi:tail fiber assembly protein [Enterobacter ludwigii]
MIIRGFKLSGEEQIGEFTIANLVSADGLDWYESQSAFKAETLKIEFDERGIITRYSTDVSMLWPVNRSVAEVRLNQVPDGLNEKGEWMFDGKKIIPAPVDQIANAEAKKADLMQAAAVAIAPLQDAVDLGIATENEVKLLSAWKMFRVSLNRVDTSRPDWPELPENVA